MKKYISFNEAMILCEQLNISEEEFLNAIKNGELLAHIECNGRIQTLKLLLA